MKYFHRIATVAILVATWGAFAVAQPSHSGYDPAGQQVSSKPPNGFLDFTLKRINPSGEDYGKCLGEDRTLLLEETVRNAYFWSNVVALGVLSWLFLVMVYQHKAQTRRELTIAEILTEFEQSLTRSRAQLAEAVKKNGELRDALAALKQCALRSPSLPTESTERAGSSGEKPQMTNTQSVLSVTPKATSAKPVNGRTTRSAPAREPVDQMRLFTPDADFVMKLNSLEQQLAQSREDNKQLRRRMAGGDRRLGAEPDRNRQLKDA
jgi:hypothetical protein